EPSLTLVIRSNVRSGQKSIAARIAKFFKRIPDNWDVLRNSLYVFKENKLWINFFGKPDNLPKKSCALTVQAFSSSSNANILAGESTVDNVNSSTHIAPKLSNVCAYRCCRD